jgi:hypothetical protein
MPPEQSLQDARFRFTPQLFVGLIVIGVGILMTLDNLQVLEAQRYLRFWPAGLIALGLSRCGTRATGWEGHSAVSSSS